MTVWGQKMLSECGDERFQQTRKISLKNIWVIRKQKYEFQHRQFKAKIRERKKVNYAIYMIIISYKVDMEFSKQNGEIIKL